MKIIEIEDELYDNVKDILEDIGLDFNSAIKIFLRKINKSNNVSFLFTNDIIKRNINIIEDEANKKNHNKYTKNIAKRFFISKGFNLSTSMTFASKNKATNVYWANPNKFVLKDNWNIILNDWQNNILYLFEIPAYSIALEQCAMKNHDLLDLQIAYNDPSFTDIRSNIMFKKYLIAKEQY